MQEAKKSRNQDLPVYKALYIYVRELYKLKTELPKTLKHDAGHAVFESALKCLRFVVIANGSSKKTPMLRELWLEIDFQWTGLRLLYDLRGMSQGRYKVLGERLVDIQKQVAAWMEWDQKQNASKSEISSAKRLNP